MLSPPITSDKIAVSMVEALLSEGLMQSISTEDRTRLGPIQKVNKDAYAAYRRGFDLPIEHPFHEKEQAMRYGQLPD